MVDPPCLKEGTSRSVMLKRRRLVPGGTSESSNAGDAAWQAGMPAQENFKVKASARTGIATIPITTIAESQGSDVLVMPALLIAGDCRPFAWALNRPPMRKRPASQAALEASRQNCAAARAAARRWLWAGQSARH